MVNEDILNYLKNGVSSGMTIVELEGNLISEGWDESDVNLAISELNKDKNVNLSLEEISLPEKLEGEEETSLTEEVNVTKQKIAEENKPVQNVLPVQENISDVALIQEKKGFLSRKNIIIIGSSFLVLVLVLILVFSLSGGDRREKIGTVDILDGNVVEFTGSKMNIKIGGETKLFTLNGIDEYIVRYTFGEFTGEIYMKENVSVDINNDGIDDVDLRLESISSGVTKIYMDEIESS